MKISVICCFLKGNDDDKEINLLDFLFTRSCPLVLLPPRGPPRGLEITRARGGDRFVEAGDVFRRRTGRFSPNGAVLKSGLKCRCVVGVGS